MPPLIIRWTIGDVSDYGFTALQMSVWGAWRLFGNKVRYVICVNTIPLQLAQQRAGEVPAAVIWRDVTAEFPIFLQSYFDEYKAEGVGWKFAPLRLSPDCMELALDNDCILWELPNAFQRWLKTPGSFLFAADVQACFGQFSTICGPEPLNSGIRGLPPGFDLEQALLVMLREGQFTLRSELDEQGLQAAIIKRHHPFIISTKEVSICSPFPPHVPNLGLCGAHFVGLNAKSLPWDYQGRPAIEYIRAHWAAHLPIIRKKIESVRSAGTEGGEH